MGNLLAELGLLAIIGRQWIAISYLIVWAWLYYKQITVEEDKLSRLLPVEYARYRRRVPRLIPLPWRFLPRSEVVGPCFSWSNPNIAHGAELERALRLVSYPLLLLCAAAVHDQGTATLFDPTSLTEMASAGFVFLNMLGQLTTAAAPALSTQETSENRCRSSR